ncbi:putative DNA primase [Gordonia phage GMA2]|uniref:Putative DNA primase n=1 Tax=Gordonia phage GMA2 TaxID=1647283 RepID=A0A0K0N7I6_9CAUD|nr:putative DNA primase [Gordonia phage GMA2]AKJ72631.1 putative DNA primase [Gordonia phage GMA2]
MTTPPPPPGMSAQPSPAPVATQSATPSAEDRRPDIREETESRSSDEPATVSPEKTDEEALRLKLANAASWYTDSLGVVIAAGHYPDHTSPSGCSCHETKCSTPAKHPPKRWTKLHNQIRNGADAQTEWSSKPWNILVLVGPKFGLFVVDVDPRSGGSESFEKLQRNLSGIIDFSKTYHYNTSSGGAHYYFKIGADDLETWKILARIPVGMMPGIDLKRAPGYVVAAPSRHISGAVYTKPADSPLTITEVDSSLAVKIVQSYRGTTSEFSTAMHAFPMTDAKDPRLMDWQSLSGANDAFRSDTGVAFGGSVGYDQLVQQLIDGKRGAVARLVSYVRVHDTLPADSVKLTPDSNRNNLLVVLFRRAAQVYYGSKDREDLKYLLEQAGLGDGTGDDSIFSVPVPEEFRTICAKIDDAVCDPPYRKSETSKHTNDQYQRKYHRLVASALVKAIYEPDDPEGKYSE